MARFLGSPLPATIGWAWAGVVERVGPLVGRFKARDAVFAYRPELTNWPPGTHKRTY